LEVIVGEGGAAEAGDVVGELAEGSPFAVGVGFGIDVAGHGDVLELGPKEEFGGEAWGVRGEWVRASLGWRWGRGLSGGLGWERGRGGGRERIGRNELEEVSGLVLEEPIAVATLFPIGEVLFGNGAVVELGGEDDFDVEEPVEPGEDGFGGNVVEEFEVKLFADGVREARDFAEARGSVHNVYFSF
jgi:hypothetical protein